MRLTFPNQQEKIIHKEIVSQKQQARENNHNTSTILSKKDHFKTEISQIRLCFNKIPYPLHKNAVLGRPRSITQDV